MNAAAAPASGMLTGTTRMVVLAIGLVLTAVVVYYLYRYLQGDDARQDMVIYDMKGAGLVGIKETSFETANIPTIYSGGEYSVSMWVYVNNWNQSKNSNKFLLRLVSGATTNAFGTLVLYMGQNINKLGVRVSYETSDSVTDSSATIDQIQMGKIAASQMPYTDTASDFKKCDIESVDLQRWVNITVVLSGRTTDVYIDGKLSRSCVNPGLYKVADPLTAKIIVGGTQNNGLGAYIGTIRAANFAYSPDMVYQVYQKGPKDESFLSQLKSWFDPSEYSFSLKKNGQDIVTATTAGGGAVGGSLVNNAANALGVGTAAGGMTAGGGTAAGGMTAGGGAAV